MGNGVSRDPAGKSTSHKHSQSQKTTKSKDEDAPMPIDTRSATNKDANTQYATVSELFGDEKSTAKYIKRHVIGKGAFGEAYLVERNPKYVAANHRAVEVQVQSNPLAHPTQPRGKYVAKVMDLRGLPPQDRQYAQTEIMCLAHSSHFAVVRYYEHYILDKDDETLAIVTEYADSGDLHRNLSKTRLRLHEREAGTLFVQIVLALHHVHSRRMMHRDLKSANLFLTSKGFVKLGDFGFSQKYENTVSGENVAGTFLGTPYYLSPEMWNGTRYGKKSDVWAAGVVLYELLMDGMRPFDAATFPELRQCVCNSKLVLPARPPDTSVERPEFSPEMRELVFYVLQKDPQKRPSTGEILHTPIMQHYLAIFEKHVNTQIAEDVAKIKANPQVDRNTLNIPGEEERALVLRGIKEAHEVVAKEVQREISESSSPRYEGVVFKDNRNGIWKERYLSLADQMLTISLSKGKEAVGGGERSKKVPLSYIKSVTPCEAEDAHVRNQGTTSTEYKPPYAFAIAMTSTTSTEYKPPYAFAIAMTSTNSIVFGVANEKELDKWLSTLMEALQMN